MADPTASWYAGNWVIPDADGLSSVLDAAVLSALPSKAANVRLAVQRVRGAIKRGGVVPVAATAGSVPPEAEQHALVLAAALGVSSKPALVALVDENGSRTGFGQLVQQAEAWLEAVSKGASVEAPTNPVGQDGVNPASDANPLFAAVRVGSVGEIQESDMTTFGN